MSQSNPLRRAILCYAIAVVAVALAVLAGLMVDSYLQAAPFVALFVCAILFASWIGGPGPGLLATTLSSLSFVYFFVTPRFSFAVAPNEILRVVLFAIAALFVMWISAAQRGATDSLRRTRDDLRGSHRELEKINEALKAENAERRRAEESSRQAEKELQETIDTIPAMVGRYRADGLLDFGNKTWRDYTGVSLDSLPGYRWGVAIHPDDLPRVESAWRAFLRTGEPFDVEQRVRRADGEYRWHFVRRVPYRNQNGEVIKWYGVAHDIDDQKQAERELQQTIDTIPTLAWRTRADGFAEYLNKRWLDYTGLSLEQVLGWKWQVAVHPDDRPMLLATWREILAGGKLAEVEARLRRCDGQYRWFLFRAAPLYDQSGRVVRWYGTNTDIEDRKQAELALERGRAYMAEAQWLSKTGSFGWRVSTNEIVWSKETYRILEYDKSIKPSARLLLDRVHPQDRTFVRQQIVRASKGERNFDYEHRLLMPDRTVKYLHVRGHRQAYETGEEEIVGALMDATAARQAQDALQAAQAELAHVTRIVTLGEMSASIAHEVNQPLTAIVTNAQSSTRWLDREAPVVEHALAGLGRIVTEANRASQIVQSIRDFAKKAAPATVELNINETVQEALMLVRYEAVRHGIDVRLEITPGLPSVAGDRIQLQQVLINLAVNAMQAMANVNRDRVLTVRAQPYESDQILIAIVDVGVGVEPEKATRLFTPFYTTKHDGLGMGLSICRSIIEAHGGRVWATVNAGPGMTFQFTLPAYS